MIRQIEHRQRQLDTLTITGLVALTVSSLAEAARLSAIDLGWISETSPADRALLLTWIVGLVVFGLAFAALWLLGRRLSPQERDALADELQLFVNRRNAVITFAATYVAAVLMAMIPAMADLPGRAVALGIMAVATGALLVGRISTVRS